MYFTESPAKNPPFFISKFPLAIPSGLTVHWARIYSLNGDIEAMKC